MPASSAVRKSRMISFRLSGKEYEIVKALHIQQGARNLSEFARTAMLRHLHGESIQSQAALNSPVLEDMNSRLRHMQTELERLTNILTDNLLAVRRGDCVKNHSS
jgi:hypothetical protein